MNKKVILVWFRNDLRTVDNEVLSNAIEKSNFIIPVYIFDPRYYTTNQFEFQNTGELRAQFVINSVYALKQKLQNLGGDLLTYVGSPEEIIPHLVQKYDVDEVYHHREIASRETNISELVEIALWKLKRNLKHIIGHTLYHKEDLPFPIKDIPNDFNTFKKKTNKESFVRPIVADITNVILPPHIEKANFPYPIPDDRSWENYSDQAAVQLLAEVSAINDMNTSSFEKLTPFISIGVISAAYIYHYLQPIITAKNKKYINTFLDNLLLRDYYRFMLKKHPNCFFKSYNHAIINKSVVDKWINAQTDVPNINQYMIKLNNLGTLSQHERETVALHFIYELDQPWAVGAAYFEQQLIDYAPASNYGFWAHMAGEGTSLKNNRNEEDWLKIKEQLLEQV